MKALGGQDSHFCSYPSVRNEARRAPLAGKPSLRQYNNENDVADLIDKKQYQRMYEAKWGGAPWMDEQGPGDKVIVLDTAPASSPSSSPSLSPSTTPSSSTPSSRRTTMDDKETTGSETSVPHPPIEVPSIDHRPQRLNAFLKMYFSSEMDLLQAVSRNEIKLIYDPNDTFYSLYNMDTVHCILHTIFDSVRTRTPGWTVQNAPERGIQDWKERINFCRVIDNNLIVTSDPRSS